MVNQTCAITCLPRCLTAIIQTTCLTLLAVGPPPPPTPMETINREYIEVPPSPRIYAALGVLGVSCAFSAPATRDLLMEMSVLILHESFGRILISNLNKRTFNFEDEQLTRCCCCLPALLATKYWHTTYYVQFATITNAAWVTYIVSQQFTIGKDSQSNEKTPFVQCQRMVNFRPIKLADVVTTHQCHRRPIGTRKASHPNRGWIKQPTMVKWV